MAVRKMKETTVANDAVEEDVKPSYGKFDVILTSFCIEYICNFGLLQYAFNKENELLGSTVAPNMYYGVIRGCNSSVKCQTEFQYYTLLLSCV